MRKGFKPLMAVILLASFHFGPVHAETKLATTDHEDATSGLPKVVSGQLHHVLVPRADHQLFFGTPGNFPTEEDALDIHPYIGPKASLIGDGSGNVFAFFPFYDGVGFRYGLVTVTAPGTAAEHVGQLVTISTESAASLPAAAPVYEPPSTLWLLSFTGSAVAYHLSSDIGASWDHGTVAGTDTWSEVALRATLLTAGPAFVAWHDGDSYEVRIHDGQQFAAPAQPVLLQQSGCSGEMSVAGFGSQLHLVLSCDDGLKHIHGDPSDGSWQVVAVESAGQGGWHPSLAATADTLILAYERQDVDGRNVYYRRWDGSQWSEATKLSEQSCQCDRAYPNVAQTITPDASAAAVVWMGGQQAPYDVQLAEITLAESCQAAGGTCQTEACASYQDCTDAAGQCDTGHCCVGTCASEQPSCESVGGACKASECTSYDSCYGLTAHCDQGFCCAGTCTETQPDCVSAGGTCKTSECTSYDDCTALGANCADGYCCAGTCSTPVVDCATAGGICKEEPCSDYDDCSVVDGDCQSGYCCSGMCRPKTPVTCQDAGGTCKGSVCSSYDSCTGVSADCESGYCCSGSCTTSVASCSDEGGKCLVYPCEQYDDCSTVDDAQCESGYCCSGWCRAKVNPCADEGGTCMPEYCNVYRECEFLTGSCAGTGYCCAGRCEDGASGDYYYDRDATTTDTGPPTWQRASDDSCVCHLTDCHQRSAVRLGQLLVVVLSLVFLLGWRRRNRATHGRTYR